LAAKKAARSAAKRMGAGLPELTSWVIGAQSTVVAALSQAISPAPKATSASVQRFSDADIWAMSRRRWRGVTGMRASRVRITSQIANITIPIESATHGYAVLSMGERSDDPAQAAMGRNQMRLVRAAKAGLQKRFSDP